MTRVATRAMSSLHSNRFLQDWVIGRTVSDADLRANSVDALRLVLAILVIFSHAYPLSGNPNEPLAILTGRETLGGVAVAGFFAMSGYLITRSYERLNSLPRFLWHRCLRIFPAFWVCLFITAFIAAPISAHLVGIGARSIFSAPDGPIQYIESNWLLTMNQYSIAGLPNNVPYKAAFDGSLWSLALEFRCYIALAIIGALGALRYARWVIPVTTALLVAGLFAAWLHPALLMGQPQVTFYNQWVGAMVGNLQDWACFFLGATAYLYRRFIPLSPALGIAAFAAFLYFGRTAADPVTSVFFLSYSLIVLGFRFAVKQTAHLRRIGDLSYGTYIYAFLVEQMLAQLGLATSLPVGVYAIVAMLITLPLAYVSWHLIEAPFLRLKSLGESRTAAPREVRPHYLLEQDRLGADLPVTIPRPAIRK